MNNCLTYGATNGSEVRRRLWRNTKVPNFINDIISTEIERKSYHKSTKRCLNHTFSIVSLPMLNCCVLKMCTGLNNGSLHPSEWIAAEHFLFDFENSLQFPLFKSLVKTSSSELKTFFRQTVELSCLFGRNHPRNKFTL